MPRGQVESFETGKGYGQLRQDQTGELLFVHESALCDDSALPLKAGQVVYFEILDGKHGRQAIDVRPVAAKEPAARNGI